MQAISLTSTLLVSLSLLSVTTADKALNIPFNTSATIGPDGPWNFITLQVGSGPASTVDFFPLLGNPQNILIDQSVCNDKSQCLSPVPNYYDSGSTSGTSNAQDIKKGSTVDANTYDPLISSMLGMKGSGYYWLEDLDESLNIENLANWVTDDLTFSSGGVSYKSISLLSLDNANYYNGNIQLSNGSTANSTTLMQDNFFQGGAGSFGLHMGAAMFGQSGSLVMGGYDSSRLIEAPLTVPQSPGFILNSVSFGISSGENPWANAENLPGNFLGSAINISVVPHVPYMYFPLDFCNQIASFLPINYDSQTQLYLWNTTDSRYHDIVTSPSYLNFTFSANPPVSIRVPFATLNLTLTAPLKTNPTQYFPCYPRQQNITLGRAFLQSAFYMQAYTTDAAYYILGQAPGPVSTSKKREANIITNPKSNPSAQVAPGVPKWEDTWKDVLKPLGEANPPTSPSTGSTTSGSSTSANASTSISGGAVAGIVIGITAAIAAVAAVIVFLIRRRRTAADGVGIVGRQPLEDGRPSELPNQQSSPTAAYGNMKGSVLSEKSADPRGDYTAVHQIDSRPVEQTYEMDAAGHYAGTAPVSELYGGDPHHR